MNSFDSAFEKVCKLVEDFKANEQRYLSPEYQEAEVYKLYVLTEEEIKKVEGKI